MNQLSVNSETSIFDELSFSRGPSLKNRLVLSPLTNCQSSPAGCASQDDYQFLAMRAKGGFSMVTTCASHVQENGIGFQGQLGCYSDSHISGLEKLAEAIKTNGAISSLQLHHAGARSLESVTDRIGPSNDSSTNVKAMLNKEIELLINDFASAALRAQKSGFDGVQIHAAHGYIIAQFISPTINSRRDFWGGSLENRLRLLMVIIEKIRSVCRADFQIGVRISPERFGLRLEEMIEVTNILSNAKLVDYIDLSLWDTDKEPEEDKFKNKKLISYFTENKCDHMRIGVAGKVMDATSALNCLTRGADFVGIGRAGILQHDFPIKIKQDTQFRLPTLPVSEEHLKTEGLGKQFISYLSTFPNFVS